MDLDQLKDKCRKAGLHVREIPASVEVCLAGGNPLYRKLSAGMSAEEVDAALAQFVSTAYCGKGE
jgi:hypothetical protein